MVDLPGADCRGPGAGRRRASTARHCRNPGSGQYPGGAAYESDGATGHDQEAKSGSPAAPFPWYRQPYEREPDRRRSQWRAQHSSRFKRWGCHRCSYSTELCPPIRDQRGSKWNCPYFCASGYITTSSLGRRCCGGKGRNPQSSFSSQKKAATGSGRQRSRRRHIRDPRTGRKRASAAGFAKHNCGEYLCVHGASYRCPAGFHVPGRRS
jgi:hypothetical protein